MVRALHSGRTEGRGKMSRQFTGKITVIALLIAGLGACGGGGSSNSPSTTTSTTAPTTPTPPAPVVSQPTVADTSRLLDQATFGVTASDVAHVQSVGFNAYLAEQLAA